MLNAGKDLAEVPRHLGFAESPGSTLGEPVRRYEADEVRRDKR